MAEVVAVVEDGKYASLTEAPAPAYFIPLLQRYSSSIVVIARSQRNGLELAGEMRQAIAKLDPRLPIYGVGSLRQMLGFVYLPVHAAAIALGAFGLLAIMLSVTGIYGLAAYAVSRRSREIGIRIAVGARPAQVLRLIFARTGALVRCWIRARGSRCKVDGEHRISGQFARSDCFDRGGRLDRPHRPSRGLWPGAARVADRSGASAARGLITFPMAGVGVE